MSKRFTDSRKWYDPWFRKLSPENKLFWFYLTDTCDHAGFWKVDLEMASFILGHTYTANDILLAFNADAKNRVIAVRNDLWHIPSFIPFQYGDLKPNNNTHIAIINRLIKAGVRQGLPSPFLGVKEKDKDKEKVKEKEQSFNKVWDRYPKKLGKKQAYTHFTASVKSEEDVKNIGLALDNYIAYIEDKKVEDQFIKHGSTWFNGWQDWINYKSPKKKSLVTEWRRG